MDGYSTGYPESRMTDQERKYYHLGVRYSEVLNAAEMIQIEREGGLKGYMAERIRESIDELTVNANSVILGKIVENNQMSHRMKDDCLQFLVDEGKENSKRQSDAEDVVDYGLR